MIAYCARDLASGRELAAGADVVMPSWSTIKLLFAAVLVTVSNLVVDIAYTWLDPRVKYS